MQSVRFALEARDFNRVRLHKELKEERRIAIEEDGILEENIEVETDGIFTELSLFPQNTIREVLKDSIQWTIK